MSFFPHVEGCDLAITPQWQSAKGCSGKCWQKLIDRLRSFDLETGLFTSYNRTPPPVCFSWASLTDKGLDKIDNVLDYLYDTYNNSDLVMVGQNIPYDITNLLNYRPSLWSLFIKLYDENRIIDISIIQSLADIFDGFLGLDRRTGRDLNPGRGERSGRYSLEYLTQIHLNRSAKDRSYWRKRYWLLRNLDIKDWPQQAIDYPLDDAGNTLEVAVAQITKVIEGQYRNFSNVPDQCRKHFALTVGGCRGFTVDTERYIKLKQLCEQKNKEFNDKFSGYGLVTSENKVNISLVKRMIAAAYTGKEPDCVECGTTGRVAKFTKTGRVSKNVTGCKRCDKSGYDLADDRIPQSDKGSIKTDRETKLESGDDVLIAFADDVYGKIESTYLPWLETGVGSIITLDANPILVSGRNSYSEVVQLLPRDGGVRDCLTARPGYVLGSNDYSAIELCGLAQVNYFLFGASVMRDYINQSGDPGLLHTALGAKLIGLPLNDMIARLAASDKYAKAARQAAKEPNFGFPGGEGSAKLVANSRKSAKGKTVCPDGHVHLGIRYCVILGGARRCGVTRVTEWNRRPTVPLCLECLRIVEHVIKPAFFEQWPEVKDMFEWVKACINAEGFVPVLTPGVERSRGQLTYFGEGSNLLFQSITADGQGRAVYRIVKESFTDISSDLFGSRLILSAHDETVLEYPEHKASKAAMRACAIMHDAMKEVLPDVNVRVNPALMTHYYKDAEAVYDDTGGLCVWEPKR